MASSIKSSALWHQLSKWRLIFKKTLHVSVQAREDVQRHGHAGYSSRPSSMPGAWYFWTRLEQRPHDAATRGQRCVGPELRMGTGKPAPSLQLCAVMH